MDTPSKINAILLNINTKRPKLVSLCRYTPATYWQNFTEIYLTRVKILQKFFFFGGGGYFFDSHCMYIFNDVLIYSVHSCKSVLNLRRPTNFLTKNELVSKKVCYQQYQVYLAYVKTVSDKVVRHSLAYLFVQKQLLVDIPFYLKIWPKETIPSITPISNLINSLSYRLSRNT